MFFFLSFDCYFLKPAIRYYSLMMHGALLCSVNGLTCSRFCYYLNQNNIVLKYTKIIRYDVEFKIDLFADANFTKLIIFLQKTGNL